MEIRKNLHNSRLAYESDREIIASGKGVSYVIEKNDGPSTEFPQLIKEPVKAADGSVLGLIPIVSNVTLH